MRATLLHQLHNTLYAVQTLLAAHAAKLGVSPAEAEALMLLRAEGPLPIGALAARTGQKPTTATALVDRLEQNRLVQRKPNPTDRRSIVITLTGQGRATAERALTIIQQLEKTVAQTCAGEAVAAFGTVCQAVADASRSMTEKVRK